MFDFENFYYEVRRNEYPGCCLPHPKVDLCMFVLLENAHVDLLLCYVFTSKPPQY